MPITNKKEVPHISICLLAVLFMNLGFHSRFQMINLLMIFPFYKATQNLEIGTAAYKVLTIKSCCELFLLNKI